MNSSHFQPARKPNRLYFQFGGCLLFAAFIPYLVRAATLDSALHLPPTTHAFWGSVAAIAVGAWLFANISTYPGFERTSYVLPAFSASFGFLLLFFIVSRLNYNRTVLIASYVLTVIWYLALQSRAQRRTAFKVGVLPFGEGRRLTGIGGVDWVELRSAADSLKLDAVAADLRTDLPDEWDRRLADFALEGIPVFHIKHLEESLTGRVELEHLSENSFGSLAPVSAFMSVKMAVDWATALVAGVILLPFMLVVGAAVRAGSPGPALFRQQRIGYKGRPFTVYKFRTMTVAVDRDADARDQAMTRSQDARVTRLGRFLRFTRIDELPQILNILRGEMSWIGPRPEAEVLSRWYEVEIPFYRYRHIVRPGVTGWAQVCQGHVTDIDDVRSKLHYDFYYIKHYSAWIDLLIIARTIRTVVTGFGSR